MLSGAQLSIAIAAVLAGAVGLGFFLHWLWVRLSAASARDPDELPGLTEAMRAAEMAGDAAEMAREEAEARHAERERALSSELAAVQADLETMRGELDHARRRIAELEAELAEWRSTAK